jgi:hypothetical protein
MNTIVENDEPLTISLIFNHISENIIGFLLLILVIVIIYIVDNINRYNSLIYAMPSPIPIPGVTSNIVAPINKMVKLKKKLKK